jgi:glutamyl-tRNA reductase
MDLVVVGLSHRTAPLSLRERLAFTGGEAEDLLRRAGTPDAMPERLLLSTCNRTELYALADTTEVGEREFLDLVRSGRGLDPGETDGTIYTLQGPEMVAHLFRVASSIDSMIVGEVQILGQVHDAFDIARRAGTAGPLMQRLLDAAFRVGKRVRSETEIGIGAVSVSYAGVSLTSRIFSDMDQRTALLVGAGETGRLAALHLKEEGIGQLVVVNRTYEKALQLAEELGGTALAFDQLEKAMAAAHVVVTATAAPEPLIKRDMVKRVLSSRGGRTLLFIDIAVPRDVEPSVAKLDNVFLYDLDALEGLVKANLDRRRREIPKVEAIIREEMDHFLRWYGALEVTPLIRELRDRFEEVRAREVEKYARKLSEKDREQVDALTKGIVNKLLHEPTTNIREFQRHGAGMLGRLETVRRLFGFTGEHKDDEA